ncbi:MAG: 50S ribosomal protein L29 [Bacteriovoracia bacterium]
MSKRTKEISSLSIDELKVKANELEGQLFKLGMQKRTGQLENTATIRNSRKELARIKTFMTQRSSSPKAARAGEGK